MTSTPSPAPEGEMKLNPDNATFDQIRRANAAVAANLDDKGDPRYGSAFGYACALTAIMAADTRPTPLAEGDKELVRYLRWLAKVTEDDARNMLGRAADRLEQLSGISRQ